MNLSLERAKAGDRAAREAVIERLRPRMERMAAYYARRSGEDREDLLQEAWMGVLEALPSLDLRIGSPEQHLIKRAKWRLLDSIKRARLRRCAPLPPQAAEEELPARPEDPLGSAGVGEFLARLKTPHRALVECLMEGLTWREAGRVLGCTSANVAYHMRQIRRQYDSWNRE